MPSWPTALGGMLFAGYAATQAQKVGIDAPSALVASALKSLGNDTGYSPSPSGRGGSEVGFRRLTGLVRVVPPTQERSPTVSFERSSPTRLCPALMQLSVLQGEVDRLHKLLSDVVRGQKGGQGYTVIHTGTRASSWEGGAAGPWKGVARSHATCLGVNRQRKRLGISI